MCGRSRRTAHMLSCRPPPNPQRDPRSRRRSRRRHRPLEPGTRARAQVPRTSLPRLAGRQTGRVRAGPSARRRAAQGRHRARAGASGGGADSGASARSRVYRRGCRVRRGARQMSAAAPCDPVLPLPQRKFHTRGDIWSFTVGRHECCDPAGVAGSLCPLRRGAAALCCQKLVVALAPHDSRCNWQLASLQETPGRPRQLLDQGQQEGEPRRAHCPGVPGWCAQAHRAPPFQVHFRPTSVSSRCCSFSSLSRLNLVL